MIRRVAFLRGINLGRRRVSNEALADALSGLGFTGVTPYQASGNVVFDVEGRPEDRELEERIEAAVSDSLGFEADAFVRRLDGLAGVLELELISRAEEEGFTPHLALLKDEVGASARAALAELETPDDRFPVLGREFLWLRRGRLTDATVEPRHLETALGGATHTLRKLTTIRRIVGKFGL